MERRNGSHEITFAMPVRDGVELVIGKRDTEFQPYVVWWCYDGNDYRYGDYTQTYEGALACLTRKLMRYFGIEERSEE